MTTVVNVITSPGPYYQTNEVVVDTRENVRWRNGAQSAAMTSAALLFIAGGMEMALGLGWSQNSGIFPTNHFQFCWFIGVIAGAIVAAPATYFLHKRILLLVSTLLVLASGIIYVSASTEYNPIIAARYISGIGIGLALVTSIVHGSEISAPSYRGTVLALEQYSFTLGIAIQVIYASQWTPYTDFEANCLHGIFVIVFGFIAFFSLYYIIESPIFYIRKCDDETALECLRLLERPQIVSSRTRLILDELKNYVIQEENQSLMENLRKSLKPFFKVLLYRSMLAFTFSVPLSWAIILASAISMDELYSWPPIVFACLRILGAFIALWIVDGLGRKIVPLFSLLCLAGLTIGVGVQFRDVFNVVDSYQMSIACTLMLISQFFAGLFTPTSSVYLGEAFSLVLKPYLIALCICIEQIIHIIVIVTFNLSIETLFDYFIAIGCIMFVLFVYFCIAMPETRNTTLNEAQKRFRNVFYLKMY